MEESSVHYSRPTLHREPYPKVDWSKINRHTIKNLPQPTELPISGCPQDPSVYLDSPNPKGRVLECCKSYTHCYLPECDHTQCLPPENSITTYLPADSGLLTAITKNKEGKTLLHKTYRPIQGFTFPFCRAVGFETIL